MKKINFKRALALLLCLCTIFGAFSLMSCNDVVLEENDTNKEVEEKGDDTVQVLRVIDDIKYGGRFTNDKLAVVTVEADAAPEGYVSDISELRSKYAAAPLCVGDYVTTAKLLSKKYDETRTVEGYEKLYQG